MMTLRWLILLIVLNLSIHSYAQKNIPASSSYIHPALVNKFYQQTNGKLSWFVEGSDTKALRLSLKNIIDSAANFGLSKNKYRIDELDKFQGRNFAITDSTEAMNADKIFTDAAISFCKDILQGSGIEKMISYDEISKKYKEADNDFVIQKLAGIHSSDELYAFIDLLDPNDKAYLFLKNELLKRQDSLSSLQKKQLIASVNLHRWLHHFHFKKYIVVNISSATLRYYEADTIALKMKVVVGKPSTRTTRFAAYCHQILFYPYWNVPASIALNELLPKFKKHPQLMDAMNMQLIDAHENIVDHHTINWAAYSKGHFPFRIRQSTGCDNSLGVIKFNLTSPLGVYLHDTNLKAAFLSGYRYYSHGCIRLEEPVELANYLLPNKVNRQFLESCLKDQVPVPVDLSSPVPVFVIYQPAEYDDRKGIQFYKDVYGLFK